MCAVCENPYIHAISTNNTYTPSMPETDTELIDGKNQFRLGNGGRLDDPGL